METVFLCREKIAKIYKDYEFVFNAVAKFIFAFMTLAYLTKYLGYYDVLNIMSIRLFIAVLCAFLPVPFVVLVMGVVAVLHLVKMSMIMGILCAVVFVIVYFLYLRFAPSQGIFMLALAVLSPFQLHYAVAFILGMFYAPVTVIPAGLTIILMRFVQCVQAAAPEIGTSFNVEKILAGYQSIVDGMMSDKSMVLMIAAMAIIIILTYVISQMPFNYSWYVAIGVAAVVNIVVNVAGGPFLGAEVGIGSVLVGTILGAVVAAFLQFMKCVVDYSKKELVQFEDDEYYYYVKAIPKVGTMPVFEEDAEDTPEELDDRRAAMKKKASKKAAKASRKEEKKAAKRAKDNFFEPLESDSATDMYTPGQGSGAAAYDDMAESDTGAGNMGARNAGSSAETSNASGRKKRPERRIPVQDDEYYSDADFYDDDGYGQGYDDGMDSFGFFDDDQIKF